MTFDEHDDRGRHVPMMAIYNADPGDENDASPERWLREAARKPAPMTSDDLSDLTMLLFRFQGEIERRRPSYGELWAESAHNFTSSQLGLVLAVQMVTHDPGHSVRGAGDGSQDAA
jgi:hypothetical protein